jgi:endonuclease-3
MGTIMSSTMQKQRLITQLFTGLKKRYQTADPESRPVLEQFLYAVCREGTTRELADRVFRGLQQRFFDWNEIRVSAGREIEEALADLPDRQVRAQRLLSILQEVFETTFSFDLESLQKKGLKQAAKQLARYQAANDFAVAWVIQHSLDGHALPLDEPTLRVLKRLRLIDNEQDDPEAIRAGLEHFIPKAKGPLFCDLISALADDLCFEEEPNCPECPLASECPTGLEMARGIASGRGHRPKPR